MEAAAIGVRGLGRSMLGSFSVGFLVLGLASCYDPQDPRATRTMAGPGPAPAAVQGQLGSQTPRPFEVVSDIRDNEFEHLTVKARTTVVWTNYDIFPHSVTTYTDAYVDSGPLHRYDTYAYTFRDPGVYTYICLYHPRMVARITVQEG